MQTSSSHSEQAKLSTKSTIGHKTSIIIPQDSSIDLSLQKSQPQKPSTNIDTLIELQTEFGIHPENLSKGNMSEHSRKDSDHATQQQQPFELDTMKVEYAKTFQVQNNCMIFTYFCTYVN